MIYIARDIDSGLVGNTFVQTNSFVETCTHLFKLGRKKTGVETGGNRKTSRTPK